MERFDHIVKFAELEEFIDVPLKNYSSGMSARLGFAVATDVDADLLIVDDTRLQVDRFPGGLNQPPARYSGEWPARAELDTFLFARGGYPWRISRNAV